MSNTLVPEGCQEQHRHGTAHPKPRGDLRFRDRRFLVNPGPCPTFPSPSRGNLLPRKVLRAREAWRNPAVPPILRRVLQSLYGHEGTATLGGHRGVSRALSAPNVPFYWDSRVWDQQGLSNPRYSTLLWFQRIWSLGSAGPFQPQIFHIAAIPEAQESGISEAFPAPDIPFCCDSRGSRV